MFEAWQSRSQHVKLHVYLLTDWTVASVVFVLKKTTSEASNGVCKRRRDGGECTVFMLEVHAQLFFSVFFCPLVSFICAMLVDVCKRETSARGISETSASTGGAREASARGTSASGTNETRASGTSGTSASVTREASASGTSASGTAPVHQREEPLWYQ